MGKDSKSKTKSRKDKQKASASKRRKRDAVSSSSSSSSGSDSSSSESDRDARKREKSEKLARKVVAYLEKTGGGPDAPFVWKKKVEKELSEGKKLREISLFSDKNRMQERLDELEKVRKRQAEREAEKARREEELTMVQRMRAAQEAMESEAKEEEFYLQALLAKAERRLREGRPTPSDLIARNLHVGLRLGEPADFSMKDPWMHFMGLQLDDVEVLHTDIKDYSEYDKYDTLHVEYWKALLEVADYELAEAVKQDEIGKAHLKGGREAAEAVRARTADHTLSDAVERDILMMLSGQTYGELCALEGSVQSSLERGEGDGTYWQAVLSRLKLQKAKAHVRDVMSRIIGAELQRLAQEAAEAAAEEGSSEEDEGEMTEGPSDPGEAGAGPSAGAGAGKAPTWGQGTAVAKAMGWAKEGRGGTRTGGVSDPSNPEEIDLGEEADGEGQPEGLPADGQQQGQGSAGEGGEGGEGALGIGVAAVGPAPPQLTFPKEVPGWGRRHPRKKRGGEENPDDMVRVVGGEQASLPEEVVADGSMSPRPLSPARLRPGDEVLNEEDDYRELELLRQQAKLQATHKFRAARSVLEETGPTTQDRSVRALLRDSGRVGVHPMLRNLAAQDTEGGYRAGIPDKLSAEDEMTLAQFKTQSLKQMGADPLDRDFKGEAPLEAQVYWWHDKYKPRKPKYFNRVHTGYEWSKYNQTHYDYDNPPPKVVQGYKFNILYHDLIDKYKAPQYVLERDPTSTDNSTCILRFIAGPPYEDIAFRIVNKEWNYARKHGFRCAFERGILHLFFNFKRTRYRR